MTLALTESNWLVLAILAGLAYVLVTCVLATLASQYRGAIAIHDRMRESLELRRRYAEALRSRQSRM